MKKFNKITKEMKINKDWILPADEKNYYRVNDALDDVGQVYWRQTKKYQVGDIVYFYCILPTQKITLKTRVLKVNVPRYKSKNDKMIDEKKYFVHEEDYYRELKEDYDSILVEKIKHVDTDKLNLQSLLKHGVKCAPRGPLIVWDEKLKSYLEESFDAENDVVEIGKSEITYDDDLYEGDTQERQRKSYERNPLARKKCLAYHGYKCAICGFDFEKFYGEFGRGIIDVHHIKPISKWGRRYKVDPINDLIPICSNCHRVIHSKKDEYSVEEVKAMVKASTKK